MEEKKKRFRPTLTAYRELEKELAEVKEELRLQKIADKHYSEDIAALTEKNETLQRSNNLMDAELKRIRGINEELFAKSNEYKKTIESLKSRGFIDRLLNR